MCNVINIDYNIFRNVRINKKRLKMGAFLLSLKFTDKPTARGGILARINALIFDFITQGIKEYALKNKIEI